MPRLVHIILFVLALLTTSLGEATAFSVSEGLGASRENSYAAKEVGKEAAAHTAVPVPLSPEGKDRLRHETLLEQPAPVAILANSQNNYRFSSSRPQRILPSYGSKQDRNYGKTPHNHRSNHLSKCHYGGRSCLLSAPFQAAVSCDYYIIALRRILR